MKTATLAILSCLSAAAFADDEHWPQWRGPNLDGRSSSTGLPTEWSESKNVKWKVKLPSWSGSTPVIWGDRILVPSPGEAGQGGDAEVVRKMGKERRKEGKDLYLLCLSKKDGKELWRHKAPTANFHMGKQNMSSPSPVTDGKLAWWLTGTGVLTALDLDGKVVWTTDLQKTWGKFGLGWGYGSSPLLFEGKVIVPVLHGQETDEPSYLVAFDGATGKVAWRVERPTDAKVESPDAFTTPMPMKVGGAMQLIIAGGDYFTGHDPATGKELWRIGGLNPTKNQFYRMVCSPAIVEDMIFACVKAGPFVAAKAGGEPNAVGTPAWTSPITCDVPTPVSDGKLLYVLNDGGTLTAFEPKTGKAVYEKQRVARGTYSASPLLADGKLYLLNESGRTTVVAAGPEFKVLAENALDDDYTLSSIAVSGKELFIRTSTSLYCISEAK
jgi:outer membrane protein assembly factor BamB